MNSKDLISLSLGLAFSCFATPSLAESNLENQYAEIAKRREYSAPTEADTLLVSKIMELIGINEQVMLFGGHGTASRKNDIAVMTCCSGEENEQNRIFTAFHEFGHITNRDADSIPGSEFLPRNDSEFLNDIAIAERMRELAIKTVNNSTATGRAIQSLLSLNPPFIFQVPELYLQAERSHGLEKRADLFAVRQLMKLKFFSPIVATIETYVKKSDVSQASKSHPSPLERALYLAGSLEAAGYDVNKQLGEIESAGTCLNDSKIDWAPLGNLHIKLFAQTAAELMKAKNNLDTDLSETQASTLSTKATKVPYVNEALKSLLRRVDSLIHNMDDRFIGRLKYVSEEQMLESYHLTISQACKLSLVHASEQPSHATSYDSINCDWLNKLRFLINKRIWDEKWVAEKNDSVEVQNLELAFSIWENLFGDPALKTIDKEHAIAHYHYLLERLSKKSSFAHIDERWFLEAFANLLKTNKSSPIVVAEIASLQKEFRRLWTQRILLPESQSNYLVRIHNLLGIFGEEASFQYANGRAQMDSPRIDDLHYQWWRAEKNDDWKARSVTSIEVKIQELKYAGERFSRVPRPDFQAVRHHCERYLDELNEGNRWE